MGLGLPRLVAGRCPFHFLGYLYTPLHPSCPGRKAPLNLVDPTTFLMSSLGQDSSPPPTLVSSFFLGTAYFTFIPFSREASQSCSQNTHTFFSVPEPPPPPLFLRPCDNSDRSWGPSPPLHNLPERLPFGFPVPISDGCCFSHTKDITFATPTSHSWTPCGVCPSIFAISLLNL